MRAHWFRTSSSVVALLIGIASAHAQDSVGGTLNMAGTASPTTTQGEIGVQARPAVNAEDQLEQSNTIARHASQLAERLSKMLDEARREKDIMRANCINRKLTEVNANTRNVEQRSRALRDAAAAGDEGRRSHEYTVLTVLSQKLDMLDREATQCLGQSVYEPGASQVITTISGLVSVVDPSAGSPPPPAPPAVTVPPPVSPMM